MIETQLKNNTIAELNRGIYTVLETYANVHRGSGHFSQITTHLYEQAREILREYLSLSKKQYTIIFCNAYRASNLIRNINPKNYKIISSKEFGLALGVTAIAMKKSVLPKGSPFQTGGGTTNLIATDWILWAHGPDKFEAGTPAIVNVIAFARALRQIQKSGDNLYNNIESESTTAHEILYHDELDLYSGKSLLNELRKTLIGKNYKVPTSYSDQPFINLDNSASTPTFTPVYNAFQKTLRQPDYLQQDIIGETKAICSRFLNAPQDEYKIIFTTNTTEAINLAAKNLSRDRNSDIEPVILNSMLEHSSNDLPWRMTPGHSLIRLTANEEGFIDSNELENILKAYNKNNKNNKKRITLVSISGASNVLGTCNNMAVISQIVHKYNAQLLVDAAQLVAHRKIDMEADGIDYLAFSGHKIYAPFGTGALIARKRLLHFNNEELEQIETSGQENAAGIAALGKALYLVQRIGLDVIHQEEQELTAKLLHGMSQIQDVKIYGIKNADHPLFDQKLGVIPFEMSGMMPNQTAKKLTTQGGIGLRYGCHCAHILVKHMLHISSGLEKFQRVMLTVLPHVQLPGVTRISLGLGNTEQEIDRFIEVLKHISSTQKLEHDNVLKKKPEWKEAEVKKQMKKLEQRISKEVYNSYL